MDCGLKISRYILEQEKPVILIRFPADVLGVHIQNAVARHIRVSLRHGC